MHQCINASYKSWNCIIKCESDVDWSNWPFSCPVTCFWLFADIVAIHHSMFTTYLSYTIWFHKLVFFFNCHIFFCCNLLLYCQIFKSLQLYLQTQWTLTCPIFCMLPNKLIQFYLLSQPSLLLQLAYLFLLCCQVFNFLQAVATISVQCDLSNVFCVAE